MPKSITIRDVPDETLRELNARASSNGRSLEEYLRAHFMHLAATPNAEAWLAGVRARKLASGGAVSAEQILAHQDADRT